MIIRADVLTTTGLVSLGVLQQATSAVIQIHGWPINSAHWSDEVRHYLGAERIAIKRIST